MVMTRSQIEAAIEAVMKPAEARLAACSEGQVWLNPSVLDWATEDELRELHRLQLLLALCPERSAAAARARVRAKREKRRQSVA